MHQTRTFFGHLFTIPTIKYGYYRVNGIFWGCGENKTFVILEFRKHW